GGKAQSLSNEAEHESQHDRAHQGRDQCVLVFHAGPPLLYGPITHIGATLRKAHGELFAYDAAGASRPTAASAACCRAASASTEKSATLSANMRPKWSSACRCR